MIAQNELDRRRRERLRRSKLKLALGVQRLWRSFRAKKELKSRRDERSRALYALRIAAAIQLERMARGFVARRRCQRLSDIRAKRNARLYAAAVRIQARQRTILAINEARRRRHERWAWMLILRLLMRWRWQCRRRRRHRGAVTIQRTVRGLLARLRVRRMLEDARLAALAADSMSLGGGYSLGVEDDDDDDADAVEVITMADSRLLQELVRLGPAEALKWYLRRAVVSYSPDGGYSMGSFLLQVMRYTSDSFKRSCEQQDLHTVDDPVESAHTGGGNEGVSVGFPDEECEQRDNATSNHASNHLDEKDADCDGRREDSLSMVLAGAGAQSGATADDADVKGRLAMPDGGIGSDEVGEECGERVIKIEKWDALNAFAQQAADGESDDPPAALLPLSWSQVVSGRRPLAVSPDPVSNDELPHTASMGGAEVFFSSSLLLPLSLPVSFSLPISLSASEETEGAGTGASSEAVVPDGTGADAAVEADWEEIGARVSVYYSQAVDMFGSCVSLDGSQEEMGEEGGLPAPMDVRTMVLQIEFVQQRGEEGEKEGEKEGGKEEGEGEGVKESREQGPENDAVVLGREMEAVVAMTGHVSASDGDSHPAPGPDPPGLSKIKKSKIFFIMHAQPPTVDVESDGDAGAVGALGSIEIPARTLFRDMLIRMLGAHTGADAGPLVVAPAPPPAFAELHSLSVIQQSIASLDSLVAGGDSWGLHPRHLFSLRMTLVEEREDEEDEGDRAEPDADVDGMGPVAATRSRARGKGKTAASTPSQSVQLTPLALSTRAHAHGHAMTQAHSQLRLLLVCPPKPKPPKKVPPDWDLLARRIQRPARRHVQRRQTSARCIQLVFCRGRLLLRWRGAVLEVLRRAVESALRVQRIARAFLACRRVQSARRVRCDELERRIVQWVGDELQADCRRWDHPEFAFSRTAYCDDADADGGRGSDIWMLCEDDVAFYDSECNDTGDEAGLAGTADDIITLQDFRAGVGEGVAATLWAAATLQWAKPAAATTAGFGEGEGVEGRGRLPVPPGCLLPFAMK